VLLSLVAVARAQVVESRVANGAMTVTVDGGELLTYQCEPNPTKVYVSRWFTPQGVQVLRDSPHDHVHHHALMYAIGVDGVDFWSEVPIDQYGRQLPRDLNNSSSVNDQGQGHWTMQQTVDWLSPAGEVLAQEERQIRAHLKAISGASLLTWRFALRPAADKDSIELWGRHYFGLGMRFAESMDKGSRFLLPPGANSVPVRGSEQLTDAKWCAVQGAVDGRPVTVAMFDAPDNQPRQTSWFTMNVPFAYLAATLKLHEQSLVVTSGQPLRLRYGIAAWDGHVGREAVDLAHQAWLKLR
jgi:hypothetical protein